MEIIPIGNLLKLDQRLDFCAGQPNLKFGRGWSAPESAFCWTEGPFSEISFAVEPSAGASRIIFDCTPKIRGDQPTQIVMFCNGKLAVATEMTERGTLEISVGRNEVFLNIVIWVAAAVTQANPNAAFPDTRRLGFCLHSVVLR